MFNLIFDFDGTLVDSFNAVIEKFSLLADELNFRKIHQTERDELKNLTSQELLKYLKIPIYKLPKVLRQTREHLRNEISVLTSFIDLPEVLIELTMLGCSLSILTSNSSENVVLWLERHRIQHLFNFIHAESSYFGKSSILKKLLKSHTMKPFATFYIGDETRDIEAAKKSNINSIAVSWGYNSEEILTVYGPDYLARAPKDLLTIIKAHIKNKAPTAIKI
jgi:phosphoglycolate phosphatase